MRLPLLKLITNRALLNIFVLCFTFPYHWQCYLYCSFTFSVFCFKKYNRYASLLLVEFICKHQFKHLFEKPDSITTSAQNLKVIIYYSLAFWSGVSIWWPVGAFFYSPQDYYENIFYFTKLILLPKKQWVSFLFYKKKLPQLWLTVQ